MATSDMRKRKTGGQEYGLLGFLVVAFTVGAFFAGKAIVDSATQFKQQMQALKERCDHAVQKQEDLTQKIKQLEHEMTVVQAKEALWRNAEEKLSKPWTQNSIEWMASRAREQVPSLTTGETSSQPATSQKTGSLIMQATGDFKALLSWLMTTEHELDVVRVLSANWKAKTAQTVDLTLNLEVDNNE
ncbi:MAG: hypothetical protein ACOY3I_06690 [Verrucomicrobiota bacterium]